MECMREVRHFSIISKMNPYVLQIFSVFYQAYFTPLFALKFVTLNPAALVIITCVSGFIGVKASISDFLNILFLYLVLVQVHPKPLEYDCCLSRMSDITVFFFSNTFFTLLSWNYFQTRHTTAKQ